MYDSLRRKNHALPAYHVCGGGKHGRGGPQFFLSPIFPPLAVSRRSFNPHRKLCTGPACAPSSGKQMAASAMNWVAIAAPYGSTAYLL